MNAIRLVLLAQLTGCAFDCGNEKPEPVPALTSSAEIVGCFLEGAPDAASTSGHPARVITSAACTTKYQFVETIGTCVKPTGVSPFIRAGSEDIPPIGLRCIEARHDACEPGRRYAMRGTVSAVVDRRNYSTLDCDAFSTDMFAITGCLEAHAEPIRVTFKQGCVVSPL
jgi:hypothetical protein